MAHLAVLQSLMWKESMLSIRSVLNSLRQEDLCEREEEHAAEAPKTKGLADTTSAHDDWLRRGPFLYDFDFHTYVRYVRRVPRPRNIRNEGGHRRVPLFFVRLPLRPRAAICIRA